MLLTTKLFVPQAHTSLIDRPRLLHLLEQARVNKLLLISAPAGFGKTTLVTAWHQSTKDGAGASLAPPSEIAWLSLDEGDNDPIRFVSYLVAALQRVDVTIGTSIQVLLQAPQPPQINALMTLLINDLFNAASSIRLVLDDYHLVTNQTIHDAVAFLVEQMPSTLRIIMTTRTDPALPLARWRVRRLMAEIRQRDLRFTEQEAAAFLNDALGTALSPTDVKALEARTEGWIAGLQLAALSLQQQQDISGFVRNFTGSNVYIIDYLVEEVLQQQSAAVEQFLLRTAILDRFCGDLCDAVTGRGDGQAMLEQLQRANLFLIALDDERRWFRYHHLLSDVLRQRLQRSDIAIATLHQCASQWLEQHALINEALHHAVAAADWNRAAAMVEEHSIPVLLRSEVTVIKGWLQAIPTSVIESRPQLALVAAWIYMASRQVDQLKHMLTAIPVLQLPNLGPEVDSQLDILWSCHQLLLGNFQQATVYAEQGLQRVPSSLPSLRTTGLLILGSALANSAEWGRADPILRETIEAGIASGNLYNAMIAYHVLSRLQQARGETAQAMATLNEALQIIEQKGEALIPAVGMIYIGLGALWVVTKEYEQAEQYLLRGEELTKACFQLDILSYGWQALVTLYRAQSHPAKALAVIERALLWLNETTLPQVMRSAIVQQLQTLRHVTPPHKVEFVPNPIHQTLIEPLTERELEVLRLVANGLSNSQIAEQLIVTTGTVKRHLNNVFGKLGVGSRTQALVRAREAGLLA